ncbi:hypothetical protein C0995_012397 [Termitomyces sp. Mi166|nr:hypothetical protein C0995_012397 [Termitomyces sp. Mi166\
MKVAVFGTRKYDLDSLNAAVDATTGIELKFIDPSLDLTTSLLAEGYEAISIFVNDICGEEVLQELHKRGVVCPAVTV